MKAFKTALLIFFLSISFLSVLQLWQIKPAQATEIWSDGFELGNGINTWSGSAGTPSIVTSPVHHGTNACRLVYNYDSQRIYESISTSYTTVFFRIAWRFSATGTYYPITACTDDSTNPVWDLEYDSSVPSVKLTRYYPSTVTTSWSTTLTADTWYFVEVKAVKGSGTSGEYRVYFDGTERITDAGLDTSSIGNLGSQLIGYESAFGDTPTIYADCAVISNAYIGVESGGGGGPIPSTNEYVTVNSTSTYEWNSSWSCVSSGNSVAVINSAIGHVSSLHGSVFVYNGTYQLSGTISMQNNVNLTLQDGVYFNHTNNGRIFNWINTQNSTLWAYTNATIRGSGQPAYDLEKGIHLDNVVNITIGAANPNGLTFLYTGAQFIESNDDNGHWVNNSMFVNINASYFCYLSSYTIHGIVLDGVQNCQFINLTIDAKSETTTRSCLVIGGDSEPSNNINITGGTYANSYADNGIYFGGWNYNVTNVRIENVTTSGNNAIAKTAHSGLKFRPASNVTVINWTSNGDYNGMELGSSTGVPIGTGSSMYNNVSGTINDPLNCGLILDMDYDDANYQVAYNWFNITVNNAAKQSVWIDDSFPTTTSVHNNTIYLTSVGALREAVRFDAGNCSYNTIYGTFTNNGVDGYPDLSMSQTTSALYNVFNIYSTTGNPNGLYDFVNGTQGNYVYYPYTYAGISIELTFPENVTYTSSSIPVSFIASGGTIDDLWFNCDNASTWVYPSNQSYSGATYMIGFINGTYTFYAWANNTLGDVIEETVIFSVEITVNLYSINGILASLIVKINGISVSSVSKVNGEP